MANKQEIHSIKTNIERTIQGLHTKLQEFRYQQTGGFVQPNTTYSIYYTLSKREVYLTGISSTTNSKILEMVKNKTSFQKYRDIKFPSRTDYPVSSKSKPTDADYRIGEITRYFTQIGNDPTQPVFEISKDAFDTQNGLYKYTTFTWKISGERKDVSGYNQTTIIGLQVDYPGINRVLWSLQLWKPPEGSSDDIQKKLLLLKKD